MALNIDFSPLGRLMEGFAGASTPKQAITQAAIAAAALGLGWLIARVLRRGAPTNPRWQFGVGGFDRVAFPLVALALMALGRLLLPRGHPTAGLEIVTALLAAMLAIRLAVYVLRLVLPQGAFLRVVLRGIAWAAWIGVALHVTGLLPEVVDALDSVGFTLGKGGRITLLLVIQAAVALFATLTIALWISRITEARVLAAESVEMSTRMVVTKLVRVSTLFVAVLVALPLVGIDVTALSVFGGALGVGLGFGLQKVASNYVSGFIVLLDHSLRIGDLVTVEGRRGVVKAIEARYTVVRSLDGTESIIPNETLITTTVTHHTYTDPKVAVPIPLQVAYGSDIDRVLAVLVEIAAKRQRVIADPPPNAVVKQLGASGVDIELVCWISDPDMGEGQLRSDLLCDILRRFSAEGIEIPSPRQDVRLIATPETLKIPSESSG